MKTVILVTALLCATSFGQTESFRSMSTGGMIQDDLDLWYSGLLYLQPVAERLLDVEGVRVYSGLSNLATGSDAVFAGSDSVRGGFLLGGSWAPPGGSWAGGVLTEFMDNRILDEITLTGPEGEPYLTGEGSVEGTWSEYVDTSGDGILDSRHTVHETAAARTDSSMTSAGVYGAYRAGGTLRLGLGLSWEKMDVEVLDAEDNGSLSVTDSNLVTGVETYSLQTQGEGTFTESRSGIVISASGRGKLTDMLEMGGMFQFASLSSEVSNEADFSGSEDYLPEEPGVHDLATWSWMESFSVSPSGSRLGGGLNLEYVLNDSWTLESSGGYYMVSLSGSADDYSISMDSSYIVTTGSFIDSTIVDMDGSGSTDIEMDSDILALGVKLTLDPSDDLVISMGAGFMNHDQNSTVTNQSQNTLVESYSDGDGEFADPDDYTATYTWSQTEEVMTTSSISRVSIPVGLEFRVLPRLYARLGASPGFVWQEETESTSLLEASPVTMHTVYGDGTEQQEVESPFETVDGTLVVSDEFYTEIRYSYGVGYSPNEHMQIDLMGLGNSFDQWRLSATLLF